MKLKNHPIPNCASCAIVKTLLSANADLLKKIQLLEQGRVISKQKPVSAASVSLN